jgi:NAD(P)-dependent dehydrogenase (short-subunit alcohol dehydrogenase family)
MASIASLIGVADRFAYSISKGAILTMTYSIAVDYVKKGIRCNAIAPARIHTPFVDGYLKANYPGREDEMFRKLSEYQPIGRMGKPAEVAALALYLCSDEAAFLTGCCYPIDGGVLTS